MVLNGVDSDQFSEIAPQGAKTATGAKGLNRHFGASTALKGYLLNVSKKMKIFCRTNLPIMPSRQTY